MDSIGIQMQSQHKTDAYLTESSSTNDLQYLEVLFVQSHLFHFRGKRFGWGEREDSMELLLKTFKSITSL